MRSFSLIHKVDLILPQNNLPRRMRVFLLRAAKVNIDERAKHSDYVWVLAELPHYFHFGKGNVFIFAQQFDLFGLQRDGLNRQNLLCIQAADLPDYAKRPLPCDI